MSSYNFKKGPVVGSCKGDNEHLDSNTRQGIYDEATMYHFGKSSAPWSWYLLQVMMIKSCLIFSIHSKTENIR